LSGGFSLIDLPLQEIPFRCGWLRSHYLLCCGFGTQALLFPVLGRNRTIVGITSRSVDIQLGRCAAPPVRASVACKICFALQFRLQLSYLRLLSSNFTGLRLHTLASSARATTTSAKACSRGGCGAGAVT